MESSIKRRPTIENKYGTAKNMSDYEKDISFLNNYFVFKKTNNVPADNVFNVHTVKSDTIESKLK